MESSYIKRMWKLASNDTEDGSESVLYKVLTYNGVSGKDLNIKHFENLKSIEEYTDNLDSLYTYDIIPIGLDPERYEFGKRKDNS